MPIVDVDGRYHRQADTRRQSQQTNRYTNSNFFFFFANDNACIVLATAKTAAAATAAIILSKIGHSNADWSGPKGPTGPIAGAHWSAV